MGKILYLSGLEDVVINIELYKNIGYEFDIHKIVEYLREKDNVIQRQFISIMFMIHSVADVRNKLCDNANLQHEGKIFNRQIQDTVYDYLSRIDSLIDYTDKLSNKISNNWKKGFYRDNIYVANQINDYRNEILHEGIPFIYVKNTGERVEYEGSVCCQFAGNVIFNNSYIELELMENKMINLYTLIDSTYNPIKDEINRYFADFLNDIIIDEDVY